MQLAHTLQNVKILKVLCLDFLGQSVGGGTLAGLMLIGISRKRYVFGNDHIDFLLHLLDLSVSKGLNTEVVIFLDLIIHKLVAAVELSNNVAIHDLIAAEFQQIESTNGVITLVARSFKPLLYEFSKFVIHHSLLLIPAKNTQFLPSETSKFCIETSVCPVVTKSSKTMMLRCGGMLLAVKTVPTRCFEGAKAQSSKNGKPSCSAMRIAMSVAKLRSLWRRFGVVTTAKSSG